jgi:hypothetical protein
MGADGFALVERCFKFAPTDTRSDQKSVASAGHLQKLAQNVFRSFSGGVYACEKARLRACLAHQWRLAPAATSPASATTAAAPASTTASPTAPAAAAPAATAPAPAAPGKFFAKLRRCSVFFVEGVKRRQTDVRNFFLTEEEFVMSRGVLHRYIHCRSSS